LLLTTKFLAEEYGKLAGKGARPGEIFLTGTPGEQIAAAIVKAEELIHTHGGPSLNERERGFVGSTPEEKTEYAVGKLLAGTVVHMADGSAMTLYDNVPEFEEYLRMVKESWKIFPAKIRVDSIDLDYTINTSEILIMPPAVINPFFQPNTNGVLPAADKATGLLQTAAREADTIHQDSPGAYPTFINAMKERFHTPIINFLIHKQSHVEVESLKEGLIGMLAHNIVTVEEIRSLGVTPEMRSALERMGSR
ncbi:hypothetical protein HYT95_02560, partial [Candidatus Peregrinibacteria bacterium]|nr:hypothetical protein [Candidatus Peregrinibacteria bacterium]